MLPWSLCRLWQPDRAANAAQDTRSYTTARGTIQFAGDIPANLVHCADSPELPGVIEIAVGIPDAASDRVVFRGAIGALKVRYGFLRSSGHRHASPFK